MGVPVACLWLVALVWLLSHSPAAFAQPTCGEPSYDRSIDAAAFLYYDCGTSDWHLRVTGGGSRRTYEGTISSPQLFESLAEFSVESSDSLQPPAFSSPSPGPIEFALIVGGNGQDGLDFSLTSGSTACFVLDSPNVPLILGSDRESAAGNTVELGGAFGPCAPDGGFVLSVADLTVPEGNGTSSAQFTVDLAPAPPPGVTVYVDYQTVDGTATAGPDYVMSSGTLTFDAGVEQQLVSIDLLGDSVPEGDEYFELFLSSANTNSVTATATITNDDGPVPPVCGTPDVNAFRNSENAVLLYWDCGTDDWHLRVTSSGASLDYLTTLSSNLLFLSMETFS
ncbi:MAG: Calx-beta domain-containing protein, partial [Gammaproteobacteria bacterium]